MSPWVWVVVAAILVGLVIAGVLFRWRRAARVAWTGELAKTTTDLKWVDSQLIPTMLEAPTAAKFTQTWTDGRPRVVAADQKLFGLMASAPDEGRTASVTRLRTAIGNLVTAVDSEAGLTSGDPDALRAARADVERARSGFASALAAADGATQIPEPEPTSTDR